MQRGILEVPLPMLSRPSEHSVEHFLYQQIPFPHILLPSPLQSNLTPCPNFQAFAYKDRGMSHLDSVYYLPLF